MNKRIFIPLFGTLFLASTVVSAATIINIEVTDLTNPKKPAVKRIGYIEDGKMSVQSSPKGKDSDLLYNKARSAITVINHQNRSFMLLDEQTIKKFMSGTMQMMNSVQEKLNQQMKGMSPEQRAQIEKMMGGLLQPPKKTQNIPVKYIKTNKTQKVNGISCQVTNLVKAGKPVTEICLAKTNSIKIPANDLQTLLSMKDTAIKLAGAAAPLLERLGAEMPEFGAKSPDGLPLMVTDLSANNRSRMTVSKIVQGKVPKGAMSIPKGYRPAQLPSSLKQ